MYADLGIRNADEHGLEAELVRRIAAVMKDQDLTRVATAVKKSPARMPGSLSYAL